VVRSVAEKHRRNAVSKPINDEDAEKIHETEDSHEAVKKHPDDLVDFVVFGFRMPGGYRIVAISKDLDKLFQAVPANPEPRIQHIIDTAIATPEDEWVLGLPEYTSSIAIGSATHAVKIQPFQSAVRPAVFHYRVDLA
jgi:hypothetical protein